MAMHPWVRRITFTRPADTTQYAAGDALSDNATTPTAATFLLSGLSTVMGSGGMIDAVTLYKSDSDLTGASFQVNFFDTQPAAAGWEDNAAIAITDAEWKRCIGFAQLVTGTDSSAVQTGDVFCKSNLNLPYEYVTGDSPIYPVITLLGTYTPASAEAITLVVSGRQF